MLGQGLRGLMEVANVESSGRMGGDGVFLCSSEWGVTVLVVRL